MRILYLIPELSTGGTERQLMILAHAMNRKGHSVKIVTFRPARNPFPYPETVKIENLNVSASSVMVLPKLIPVVVRFKPEVMHTFLFGFDLFPNIAARLCRVPCVVSSRRQLATWQQRRHRIFQSLGNIFVDAVAANSRAALEYAAVHEAFLDLGRCYFVPNVYSPRNNFPFDDMSRSTNITKTIITHVANMRKGKRHDQLLHIFSKLATDFPNVELWLVGDGDYRQTLEAEAECLDIKDKVRFLGLRHDIDNILKKSDLHIHLTTGWDSNPNAILEAMANGVPVVAIARAGVPELLGGGRFGTLVADNEHQIEKALRHELREVDARENRTASARHHVLTELNPDRAAQCCEHLYQNILANKKKTARGPATVALVTVGDISTPSTRFRILQHTHALQQDGFLLNHFRLPSFKNGNLQQFISLFVQWAIRAIQLHHLKRFDVAIVQKDLTPGRFRGTLRLLLGSNVSYVFDCDDSITQKMSVKLPRILRWLQNEQEPLELAQNACLIFAGNSHVQKSFQLPEKTNIVPTTVSTERYWYTADNFANDARQPVLLCWAGQRSNLTYLEDILDALDEVARDIKQSLILRIICDSFNEIKQRRFASLRIECRRWSLINEIADIADCHIGLMPQPNNAWTRGKCGFKAIQCMALGIPPVCSPVGVNKEIISHGHNGLLASSSADWKNYVKKLSSDWSFRRKLGKRARQTIEQRYTASKASVQLLAALHTCSQRS